METIAQMILAAAENDRTALMFEGQSWTYREYVQACIARAHLLLEVRAEGPFHVGSPDRGNRSGAEILGARYRGCFHPDSQLPRYRNCGDGRGSSDYCLVALFPAQTS